MPGVFIAGWSMDRKAKIETLEGFVIALNELFALPLEPLDFPQLMDSKRGCDIGHVVLESRRHDLIRPRGVPGGVSIECVAIYTVQPHHPAALRDLGISRDHHPTLAGGQSFGGVKAENGGIAL